MDKYIKVDSEVWKKLKLATVIDETNVKALATKYIMAGLKKRFYKNPKVIRDLGRITKDKSIK